VVLTPYFNGDRSMSNDPGKYAALWKRFLGDRLGELPRLRDVTTEDDGAGVVVLHGKLAVVLRTAHLAPVLARIQRALGNVSRSRQATRN
jgi:hypothetical protein